MEREYRNDREGFSDDDLDGDPEESQSREESPSADVLDLLAQADPARHAPVADAEAILARVREVIASQPPSPRGGFFSWLSHPARALSAAGAALALVACVAAGSWAWGHASGMSAGEQVSASVASVAGSAPYRDALRSLSAGVSPLPESAANRGAADLGSPVPADAKMSAMYPGFSGFYLEAGPGLSADSSPAAGFVPDRQGHTPAERAALLASALGVDGKPRDDSASAVVGSPDGSSSSVWVSDDPMLSWSFSDPSRMPWACPASEGGPDVAVGAPLGAPVSEPDPGVGSAGGAVAAPSCRPQGQPLGQDRAVDMASRVLLALGLPLSDVRWDYGYDESSATSWLTGYQMVGTADSQQAWSFTFDREGIAYASGPSVGWVKSRDYQTVSPLAAVERSRDPRFSSFGPSYAMGYPAPMKAGGLAATSATAAAISQVAPATAQGAESSPARAASEGRVLVTVSPVTVTSAERALAPYWQADGALTLLPSYLVKGADGQVFSLVSIAESEIEWSRIP